VLGASPEMLVRLDQDDLLLCPIAGTRPRGQSPDADATLERKLLADKKELAEHRMLVDLGRNDLGRIAQSGSVHVDRAARVVRYSHVMHIVSDVPARVAPGRDAYDVLRACFPAGTVSGAPKVRACELIAQLEPDRRDIYAGAVGYINFQGNMDTCIAIRTLVISRGRASLQTGAGVVYDSILANEVDECWNKARAGLVALAVARRRSVAVPKEAVA
jgi:anthranilate synthase component I